MKIKKILSLVLALVLLFSLAACGSEGSSTGENSGNTGSSGENSGSEGAKSSKDIVIIANTSGEPGNIHPYNSIGVGAGTVARHIMEYLFQYDGENNMVPELAETWEVTDTGITFNLRKGVKFHNGEEMKASDVVFSFKECILNSTGGYAANLESIDVDNIEAKDDYTVYFPLLNKDSNIMPGMAAIYIVSEKAYNEMGEDFQYDPVGTGPYTLADWVTGDHIDLEKFDEYWGGEPLIKTVRIRTINEVSQAMIELETGGVDILIQPSGEDVKRVNNGEVKGVKAVTNTNAATRNNNVNFNWLSPYFSNQLVREAVAHCIDRETWASIISPGTGSPAYSMVAAGVWGYDTSLEENYPYEYDLELAKQKLTEAGYPDGFTCIMFTDARAYHQSLCELLENSLKQIGITMEIQTMELTQQKEIMVTGEGFDLYMLDNIGNAASFLASLWRDSHPRFAGVNSTHHHFYSVNDAQGQRYSDLMDAIREELDDDKRAELAKELQEVFTEDLVWIPVNTIAQYTLVNENLEGFFSTGGNVTITQDTYFK